MIEVRRYVTASGRDVVGEWMAGLKDTRTRAKVAARLARLQAGNFGDCKPVGEGVWELRVDWGDTASITRWSAASSYFC
jgi:putative addiction module killer protein